MTGGVPRLLGGCLATSRRRLLRPRPASAAGAVLREPATAQWDCPASGSTAAPRRRASPVTPGRRGAGADPGGGQCDAVRAQGRAVLQDDGVHPHDPVVEQMGLHHAATVDGAAVAAASPGRPRAASRSRTTPRGRSWRPAPRSHRFITGVPLAARANHGAATVSTKVSATSLRQTNDDHSGCSPAGIRPTTSHFAATAMTAGDRAGDQQHHTAGQCGPARSRPRRTQRLQAGQHRRRRSRTSPSSAPAGRSRRRRASPSAASAG